MKKPAISSKYFRLALLRLLLPESRSAACMRIIARGKQAVDVLYRADRRSARYGNLCACANGWICPICAARISEKRAESLKAGLLAHPEVYPILATFTMQHHAGMRLIETLNQLSGGYRALTQARAFREFAHGYAWESSIAVTEITYGNNGWHPHMHVLALMKSNPCEFEFEQFSGELAVMWQKSLEQHGAKADLEHGTDIRQARYSVAEYIAKFGHEPADADGRGAHWGIDREIAKSTSKVARRGGMSPQGLLIESQGDGENIFGKLFREYYLATYGRKIMTFSKKAKEMLSLPDEEDQEIAESADAIEQVLASISRDQWRLLLNPDRRAELLQVAASGSAADVEEFISGL